VLKTIPPESIRPDINDDSRTRKWIDREIMVALAGVLAEAKFTGRRDHIGASGDYSQAIDLGSHFYGYDEVLTTYIDFMLALTRAKVEHPYQWIQIEALAAALIEHRHIGARKAREICGQAYRNRARRDELSRAFIEQEEAKRLKRLALAEREGYWS
jgi:hypothetical protein